MTAQQTRSSMSLVLATEIKDHLINYDNIYNRYYSVVKTVDDSISFMPCFSFMDGECSYEASLTFQQLKSTRTFLVLCELVFGWSCTLDLKTNSSKFGKEVVYQIPITDKASEQKVLDWKIRRTSFLTSKYSSYTLHIQVYKDEVQGASLHLNRARLFNHLCDVTLEVEGVELPAHRLVLGVRSPVFERMLAAGNFKEDIEGRVEIKEFSRKVVENFLEFLYTNLVQDWGGSELELLKMADKYDVPELRTECMSRLRTCDGARALELLSAAVDEGPGSELIDSTLRRRLTCIVVDNMWTLAATQQWEDFKKAHPLLVDVIYGSVIASTSTRTTLAPELSISLDSNK